MPNDLHSLPPRATGPLLKAGQPPLPEGCVVLDRNQDVTDADFDRIATETKAREALRASKPFSSGRAFYLGMIAQLEREIATTKMDASNFHSFFFMLMGLGASPRDVASSQLVKTTRVSAWLNCTHTPSDGRREGILLSALESIRWAIGRDELPPFRVFSGRRAGRPVVVPAGDAASVTVLRAQTGDSANG